RVYLRELLWQLDGSRSTASSRRARTLRGCGGGPVLASVHRAFFARRFCASAFQPFCTLRPWPAAGALNRRDPVCNLLPDLGTCLKRRGGRIDRNRIRSGSTTGRCIGMHHGNSRCVGGIFSSASICAEGKRGIGEG